MSLFEQLPNFLVPWHRANKRDLPWRVDSSPYHTWLSEIMLQQTRIEAVIPYYYRFLNELPTIEALANASEERLLKMWEGLGYYSRVRNLKKAALLVMEQYDGRLPASFDQLRRLPGIGDYTAGAIASMAFGLPEPAVDGNVLRVVTRITGNSSDITLTATKKEITQLLRSIYPSGEDAGDFTEGLMELGETICIPVGAPRCENCPVKEICVAYRDQLTEQLPVKSEKKKRKIEKRTVLVLQHGNLFALQKRPAQGLLAGMWELPNFKGHLTTQEICSLFDSACGNTLIPLQSFNHIFTHIEWHMQGYHLTSDCLDDRYTWVTSQELLHDYALPTAFRSFKDYILALQEE